MELEQRFDRLDTFIKEGRLVRKRWGDGQEHACLLLALVPEVGAGGALERCPASVLPGWLGALTPAIDDNGSPGAWPGMVQRYATVVRRGAVTLDDAGWRHVLARFMLAVLKEAEPSDLSEACRNVSTLWNRVLMRDDPTMDEWETTARAAVYAATCAATWPPAAAYKAAYAAVYAATWPPAAYKAAYAAADAAADAATYKAADAATYKAADAATYKAAYAAVWDRVTEALFEAIETEASQSKE